MHVKKQKILKKKNEEEEEEKENKGENEKFAHTQKKMNPSYGEKLVLMDVVEACKDRKGMGKQRSL